MAKSFEDRFYEKLMPIPESGCLIYLGYSDKFGYGKINVTGSTNERTHRVAWMLKRGKIPEGMCVLHKCDVPSCCNVEHLFLGTRTDNAIDKAKKGRGLKKLKINDFKKIKQSTESQTNICNLFGISQSMVSMIKSGKQGRFV